MLKRLDYSNDLILRRPFNTNTNTAAVEAEEGRKQERPTVAPVAVTGVPRILRPSRAPVSKICSEGSHNVEGPRESSQVNLVPINQKPMIRLLVPP